jgi:small-conductance mechanosensitive channel
MDNVITSLQELVNAPQILTLLKLIIGLLFISLLSRFVKQLIVARVADVDFRYRVRKLITLLSYGVAVIYAIATFSDSLAQMTVLFGVVGASITLALQDIIASLAGWVAISLGRYFDPGDRILLGEHRGDVIDISLLSTTIMECGDWVNSDLYNGRIVKIPNNKVFKNAVINYSKDFPFVWDELVLPIRHGSDRALAQTILEQAATTVVGEYVDYARMAWESLFRRYFVESAGVEPMVTLRLTENWLEYTLRYVVNYKQRRAKQSQLFNHIMASIERSEGRVKVAVPPLQLVQTQPMEVQLSHEK